MTRSVLRRAGWALLFSLACNRDTAREPPVASPGVSDLERLPPSSDPAEVDGTVCRVDADCGSSSFCELRVCVTGCAANDDCPEGASCGAHGRCALDEGDEPKPASGTPVLVERFTVLGFGETIARTTLRNDGAGVLKFRLDSANPALAVDPTLAELAPGAEVELHADVHVDALAATDRLLPVQIITSGGALLWSIEIEAAPESGQFRGAVAFEVEGASLGGSDLVLDLDFRDDGTIAGRVDTDASLLWPQPLSLTGTWAPSGDVTIELRDRLPADGWRYSPLARELGRTFTLTGTRSAAGLEGTLVESITGLRDAPVEVEGTFVLRRHGPLTGLVHAAEDPPGPAATPTWLAPLGLDTDACEGLGTAYGTPETLVEPTPACDACADSNCPPEDKLECADALRTSAYHLPAVLAELNGGGQVKPPSTWTWDECTAATPPYTEGQACLDIAAMRCAHALLRRGAEDTPGMTGEFYRLYAALYAADEALAAGLLSTETQIDAAFAYKDELGAPVSDVLARELQLLSTDRQRLAAALAPTLAPAFPAALDVITSKNPDLLDEHVALVPLALVANFAGTTARWARLADLAGTNVADVRAAVRLAAIATHAAGAELHARLHDHTDAAVGFHALGPALQSLASVHAALHTDTSFGYPAAYVPLALSPQDLDQHRSNFEAVHLLATDDLAQLEQVFGDAWNAIRDYEQKTYALDTTVLQLEVEYDGKLRALCGSLPGETRPALEQCGQHGGQIAELKAALGAAGLRIRHAAQAVENNLHAIAVEEERFGKEVAIHLDLQAEIEAAQGQIFKVQDAAGKERSALAQAEAAAECSRVRENANAEVEVQAGDCMSQIGSALFSGPSILGTAIPNPMMLAGAIVSCQARAESLSVQTENQCASIHGQAGLESAQEELARNEEQAVMAINAEIDAAIRKSDLEVRRAASVALVKNIRAEGLLLQIEVEEAELARDAARTAMWSAYQEVGALMQEKAQALGLMVEDSPDNALTRPHFLQARLEAARRVLPVREQTARRVYLALRALEYELNQPLPTLRDTLAAARSPADFAGLLACLDSIFEDYRLEHGFGQPYVTEVSLRSDIFGITRDVVDVDGTAVTPGEQFAALLRDPLHRQPDGSVALPFALSAFEHALFSSALCDDRLENVEIKLVGDHLGDREAEVWLTRQGLAGVRRCDGADLPSWSAYVPYSFEREQIVIQAGVGDFGTAGPNAGYAAWPVHGEQWTLTIPPADKAPTNIDLDLHHVADVVLRLHHRAGSIAPAGQGVFTPSCGG
ncbi:hypothetical protein SAMN02745121_08434 [Nannocystis exedens]|uniref:Uncharacterized protein n=1 Tax=Nannocystis exedens TaxID=54 RepID=A0A1I2I8C7_9BACT|nr:hypothetical protein NAEX_07737 [Nannocystis exedens]SFF37136.1 hypothetical protein SAMN02745121_08434 [Nannocystis exedens]